MCRYPFLLGACVMLWAGIALAGEPGQPPGAAPLAPDMPATLPARSSPPARPATQPKYPTLSLPATKEETAPQVGGPPDPPPPAPPYGDVRALNGLPVACVPCEACFPAVTCNCPAAT